MNEDVKSQWTTALRSGEYAQTKGQLANADRSGFCCLGVLCDLAEKAGLVTSEPTGFMMRYTSTINSGDSALAYLPRVVRDWAGLAEDNPIVTGGSLSRKNDNEVPFSEIADLIDSDL